MYVLMMPNKETHLNLKNQFVTANYHMANFPWQVTGVSPVSIQISSTLAVQVSQ